MKIFRTTLIGIMVTILMAGQMDMALAENVVQDSKGQIENKTLVQLNSSILNSSSNLIGEPGEPAVPNLEPARLQVNLLVGGLDQPLAIANAGDSSDRIFVVERDGLIRIIHNGSLVSTPFLDMRSIVNSSSNEQGLLALAFHPLYEVNGYFYTVHTNSSGSVALSRFSVSAGDPDQADFGSRAEILSIPHPIYTNHNGGDLKFGAEGYLYWSTGDGGGGGDPFDNSQDLYSLLGKILRLDVDSAFPYAIPASNPFYANTDPSVRKEIWALGLRNPWRFSFDRLTNDMYIGDVGQGVREEIDFQPAGSVGGENYGWNIMEGSLCYNSSSCDQTNKVLPVAEYSHSLGCSVTGGYVYRGAEYPGLQGHYFYGDFCQGRIFHLYHSPTLGWVANELANTSFGISTFGEDENGELYVADYFQGKISQLGYIATTFVDVPETHPYYDDIEILYANGYTGGCSTLPLLFCPDVSMSRAQTAVFMLRGNFGSGYVPVTPTHIFGDNWKSSSWGEGWAESMYIEGLTAGCSLTPLKFCPDEILTNVELAVFGLRLKYGVAYSPPAGTGTVFADMTDTSFWGLDWSEQAYADGFIPSCGTDAGSGLPKFCPNALVSRGFGASVIVNAKNLTMP